MGMSLVVAATRGCMAIRGLCRTGPAPHCCSVLGPQGTSPRQHSGTGSDSRGWVSWPQGYECGRADPRTHVLWGATGMLQEVIPFPPPQPQPHSTFRSWESYPQAYGCGRVSPAPPPLQHLGEQALCLDWAAPGSWPWRRGCRRGSPKGIRAGELTCLQLMEHWVA